MSSDRIGIVNPLSSLDRLLELDRSKLAAIVRQATGWDLIVEFRDIANWRRMATRAIRCLEKHRLYAACVTGEATIMMYRDEVYQFVHSLASTLDIHNKRRLQVVTGPMVNVSDTTGRSVVVELFRDRLANLYCSQHRQAVHYRIGGFGEEGKENELNQDLYAEEAHPPLERSFKRMRRATIASASEKKELVKQYVERFERLLKSDEILPIKDDPDLERFIFLTSGEIRRVWTAITAKHGEGIYKQQNETKLSRELIMETVRELRIAPRTYPEG